MAQSILCLMLERKTDLKHMPSVPAFKFVTKLSFLESAIIEYHSHFLGNRAEELGTLSKQSPYTLLSKSSIFNPICINIAVNLFTSFSLSRGRDSDAFPQNSPRLRKKEVCIPTYLGEKCNQLLLCTFMNHSIV
uniref:Alternative protein PCSK6 n=1 Tax=Homo sapiens TaxID=9606 RepID=L8EAN7_HUMAN|nr:alternative protein PCSK6 [Homo sapiens]